MNDRQKEGWREGWTSFGGKCRQANKSYLYTMIKISRANAGQGRGAAYLVSVESSGCPGANCLKQELRQTPAGETWQGEGRGGLTWHMLSWVSTPSCCSVLCHAASQEGVTGGFPSPCPFTAALCIPTAGAIHPDELEARPGTGPAAHSPEPDNHHAGTGCQPHEPDHSSDPQADCGGGTGKRRAPEGQAGPPGFLSLPLSW